jgi:ABC-type multidrug transport system fused ATPase/permease subunit
MFGNWDFSIFGISLRSWTLMLLLTELGLVFLFLGGPTMKKIYVQERQQVSSELGQDALNHVEKQSSGWFQRTVVDTGVLAGSYSMCKRRGSDKFDDRGLGKLFADRLDVFWVAVRQMFFRFAVVAIWLPCVLLLFPVILFDGIIQRQILKYQSGASSPMMYHAAGLMIALVFMLLLLAPFMPLNIMAPLGVPLGLSLMGAAIWCGVVRSAKRL